MTSARSLDFHLKEILSGSRKFENVFQSITRMILSGGFEKVNVLGRTTYDFKVFRQEEKHLIGMFDEINSFVSFVKDAAEGGSSSEMAYVLIGEPGNGKTFFVDYLCDLYRDFLSQRGNERFTFRFNGIDQLSSYGAIRSIESQTFEDPLILVMNLFGSTAADREKSKEYLSRYGFDNRQVELFFENYRPLGACSDFILNQVRDFAEGNVNLMKNFIEVVPVTLSPTQGNVTGKYPAKDKITSSSVDLIGEESIQRLLHISDTNNPYRFDLRRGALARVGGGGIHFADEIFKNKKDLIKVYLGVIQNRVIELDGFRWPIDTLVIATSNNNEFNRFKEDHEEDPIVDRCRTIYMSHTTNFKLQRELTAYALGKKDKTTFSGDPLHVDPFLIEAVSDVATQTRLPLSDKLTQEEIRKLAAGEMAGEKSINVLLEVYEELSRNTDITRRFGQKGLGQRDIGRALQLLIERSETQEGKCMCALDVFDTFERVVLDYVQSTKEQAKYLGDVRFARELYRKHIEKAIFDAYMDEKDAIVRDVRNYVNMIVALGDPELGSGDLWSYKDPQSREAKSLRIDRKYVDSVESRMGLKTEEQKESFRSSIRQIYGQRLKKGDVEYDFMDNQRLLDAVTEVRLDSDINSSGSLVGALANRTREENQGLYNRMIETMEGKLGFCPTCADKTLAYYCIKEDKS